MIPLIIGGVTLAAVGYVVKEICDEQGCPWDEPSYTHKTTEKDAETETTTSSKKFHKFKKTIYKTSMKEYQDFLEKYKIQNHDISTDAKLEKQKFSDELITDEAESYITQISNTLEILSHNLSLGIKLTQNKQTLEDDATTKINEYANSIYVLSHLKIFDERQQLNKIGILSILVQAMGLTTQKDTIHVDLNVA